MTPDPIVLAFFMKVVLSAISTLIFAIVVWKGIFGK